MNDTVFIIFLGICLLAIQFFLAKIKEPKADYVKLLSAVALLILVWVGSSEAPFGPKLILTSIAFSGIWKAYLSLKRVSK